MPSCVQPIAIKATGDGNKYGTGSRPMHSHVPLDTLPGALLWFEADDSNPYPSYPRVKE